MNDKITLPTLTHLLALRTGDTKKQSEDFIKEFIGSVSAALAEGEQVKIKNFGVFKTIAVEPRKSVNVSTGEEHQIPAHRKVVFVPAKEIAAVVNEPFEMFETVELSEDYIDDDPQIDNDRPEEGGQTTDDDRLPDYDQSEDDYSESEVSSGSESFSGLNEEPTGDGDRAIPACDGNCHLLSEGDEPEAVGTGIDADGVIDEPLYSVEDAEDAGIGAEAVDTAAGKEKEGRMSGVEDADSSTDGDVDYGEDVEGPKSRGSFRDRFFTGFISGALTAAVIGAVVYMGMKYIDWDNWRIIEREGSAVSSKVAVNAVGVDSVVASVPEGRESHLKADGEEEKAASAEVSEPEGDGCDKAEAAPTAPSDKKVYDTISKTRYLTTMAKDHYGNFNLWPYIYMENKAFLGHPDRIKPGTQVVVPPLSKYGVDPDNPSDISKAKRLGVEIYSRYKK